MFDCDDDKERDDGAIYDDEDNSYSFLGNDSEANQGSEEIENLVNIDLQPLPPPVSPSKLPPWGSAMENEGMFSPIVCRDDASGVWSPSLLQEE